MFLQRVLYYLFHLSIAPSLVPCGLQPSLWSESLERRGNGAWTKMVLSARQTLQTRDHVQNVAESPI
jgi:hypothetical protein